MSFVLGLIAGALCGFVVGAIAYRAVAMRKERGISACLDELTRTLQGQPSERDMAELYEEASGLKWDYSKRDAREGRTG